MLPPRASILNPDEIIIRFAGCESLILVFRIKQQLSKATTDYRSDTNEYK